MDLNKYIEKVVDKIFSINKKTLALFGIFIVGFIIRVLAALRNKISADEMVHGVHSIGFINSGKLQIMDQGALWFWMSDFFMKLFGTNIIGIKFTSILFGSLLLVVIYFIAKELFDKKTALISILISLISYFQLDNMEASLDITMTFFVFLSIYFFIIFTKNKDKKYFYLIWISIGLAVMSKPVALPFAFSIFICSAYYHFIKNKSVKLKDYLLAGLLLFVMFLPVLTFNLLLYQEKGIVDLQFARFTGISFETYKAIAPTIEGFNAKSLIIAESGNSPGLAKAFSFLYTYESSALLLFSLIGLFYFFKNKDKFAIFLSLTFLIPFIFLAGTSLLPNHFVFASFYAVLFAAHGINKISITRPIKKYSKQFIYIIIALIIIISYIQVRNGDVHGLFGQKDPLGQTIDFKEEDIPENAIVVSDGRIYRGRTVFMFWDRNYIEGSTFIEILSNMDDIPGERVTLKVYYIECIPDDCGWGTIKDQPEFNSSMEQLVKLFSTQSELVKTINDVDGKPYFNIYSAEIIMKSSVPSLIKSTHEWFYYPVNYQPKERIFDNYETQGFFSTLLDTTAHWVLYLELILAGLSVIYIFYLILGER
ncbi:MAG: glycosyltransferase family 39 protein [Candidatus Pacearchaeota archaeon]|nr:glycosyltransferase family 39 protein [Candidatus Pacearchaeota archaeon]